VLLGNDTWQSKVYIGEWREGRGGSADVTSPATGETLAQLGVATGEDVADAAALAAKAQRAWAQTPYDERARVMRRAGQLWEEHAEEVAGWITHEAGSIAGKAQAEAYVAAQECFEAAALASAPYGEVLRSSQPRLSIARRVPAGVVGVISPFNFPLILAIRAVAPALALGNAVLLKPDTRTAVGGGVLIARIFEEAGLPAGVLSLLPGGADVGQAVVTDPHVRVIAFTGSTAAGRKVGALAAEHLKRVHLELGGNNALVVFDDVDLDAAASVGAWGSFFHQGQICMATGRHLVQASVAEEYAARLAEHAEKLTVGNPADPAMALGPIIDERQRDHVHRLVTESVQQGARLLTGGTYEDLFYRPTVLDGVSPTTAAYREEVFGPVAPVVPFETVEDAVALASGTEYGLSFAVLTRDIGRGLAIADAVPSGLVHINDQTVGDEVTVPFGGLGASGTGSRHGGIQANMEAFTETQWLTVRGDLPSYPF
jgi:benzaldehyde dehydrogenase (NAD)